MITIFPSFFRNVPRNHTKDFSYMREFFLEIKAFAYPKGYLRKFLIRRIM